jgi:hypothetical protein
MSIGKQMTFTTMGGETVTVKPRGKHYVEPRGYFFHPGTGPDGETCGSCRHCSDFRRWKKCGLNRSRWTGGRGSDVLAGAKACKYWEGKELVPVP